MITRTCGVRAACVQRRKYEWTTHVIINYYMSMCNILTNWPGKCAAYVRRTCVLAAGAYKNHHKHSLRKHTHSVRRAYAQCTCGAFAAYVRRTCVRWAHTQISGSIAYASIHTAYAQRTHSVRRTCGVRAAFVRRTCGVFVANYLNPTFEYYRATIAD